MEKNSKPLSTFWKVLFSLIAVISVSTWVFRPRETEPDVGAFSQAQSVKRAATATQPPAPLPGPTGEHEGPLALSLAPKQLLNSSFSVVSNRGDGAPVIFNVFVWEPTLSHPCIADVTSSAPTPRLGQLKAAVAYGNPDGRLGVLAQILAKCTSRFIYLDGGGEPGKVGEYLGKGVKDVVHGVRVNSEGSTNLVLEFFPGTPPDRADELARLETLISESDRAIGLVSQGSDKSTNDRELTDLEKMKSRYQYELGKFKQTDNL